MGVDSSLEDELDVDDLRARLGVSGTGVCCCDGVDSALRTGVRLIDGDADSDRRRESLLYVFHVHCLFCLMHRSHESEPGAGPGHLRWFVPVQRPPTTTISCVQCRGQEAILTTYIARFSCTKPLRLDVGTLESFHPACIGRCRNRLSRVEGGGAQARRPKKVSILVVADRVREHKAGEGVRSARG